MNKAQQFAARRRILASRAKAYIQAAAHLRTVEWNDTFDAAEADRVAAVLERTGEKILRDRPPYCRTLPYAEWCDVKGRGDFMGHTCEPTRRLKK